MSTATQTKPLRHSNVMAKAWAQCEEFNAIHPVGTKVQYRSLRDEATHYDIKETVIRSEAWTLPSGDAVVMIEGKAGGVSLDHLEATF